MNWFASNWFSGSDWWQTDWFAGSEVPATVTHVPAPTYPSATNTFIPTYDGDIYAPGGPAHLEKIGRHPFDAPVAELAAQQKIDRNNRIAVMLMIMDD